MGLRARLIVTYECRKNCIGCCNRGWKYDPPKPICHLNYEEILITGGEPLLFPEQLIKLINDLKIESHAKIFVYTAMVENLTQVASVADGMTLTLHEHTDVWRFNEFVTRNLEWLMDYRGSLRLNVFNGVIPQDTFLFLPAMFKVKFVDWIKDCPLPAGEELVRLEQLWKTQKKTESMLDL